MAEEPSVTPQSQPPIDTSGTGYPFDLYVYDENTRGYWTGGAPDVTTACILAGAWLTTAQQMYPQVGKGIGVIDPTDTVVAYIGWKPQQ